MCSSAWHWQVYLWMCPSWRHIFRQPRLSWLTHNLFNIYYVIKQNCTACWGVIPPQRYMFKKEKQVVGLTGTITRRTMFLGFIQNSLKTTTLQGCCIVKSSSLKYFWSIFRTSLLNYYSQSEYDQANQKLQLWAGITCENSDRISTGSILCVTNWLHWY